jgi:hypothetical protein
MQRGGAGRYGVRYGARRPPHLVLVVQHARRDVLPQDRHEAAPVQVVRHPPAVVDLAGWVGWGGVGWGGVGWGGVGWGGGGW